MPYRMKNALYQTPDIRRIEARAIEQGVTEYQLMQRAGKAAFRTFLATWPDTNSVIVCCGRGNNAGDGFVFAHEAQACGFRVTVYVLSSLSEYDGAAAEALKTCQTSDIAIQSFTADTVFKADVIVDALLGTGLKGMVSGLFEQAIAAINSSEATVLSLD